MIVRSETAADTAAIRAVNLAAFPGSDEADLVEKLRERASPLISLVAETEAGIIGHILFSPVTFDGDASLKFMGLAPMAVLPDHQRSGIGSALVQKGLDRCRELEIDVVIVLGHPEYYPRFGFRSASSLGIGSEYDVPDDVFMAQELRSGCLSGATGTARYHAAFAGL